MKNLIETTTGYLSSQMILDHCGDYAGKFQDEAFSIFQELRDGEPNYLDANQWADIMFDRNGNVYAIYAEDSLTCQNAWCFYVQLDHNDCPKAFEEMNEKNRSK
jgi:viroplasmin and RNaseH domain-containing protein